MGVLRTLFAISVVFAHSLGYLLVGGRNAVQLFYMISGFLISYVLVERKAYPQIGRFYLNRYLRLYPIYFAVALLSLLTFEVTQDAEFFNVYRSAPFAAKILLVFSNATLFLQDWVHFSAVKNEHLVFATSFWNSDVLLYHGLVVPQAWTLGLELTFYFIAPFILPRMRVLLTLLALSVALRIYLLHIGLAENDPWTYRFFPTELALFLLGALAHQVMLPFYRRTLSAAKLDKVAAVATYSFVFLTLVFSFIRVEDIVKSMVLFVIFFALMPFFFVFQIKNDWDKRIGDLSYPIYISHLLIIYVITVLLAKFGAISELHMFGKSVPAGKLITSLGAIVLAVAFSIFLNRYIGGPVESIRNRFRTKKQSQRREGGIPEA